METTIDTMIFDGLKICQPASGGFRFGCDSPILAYFANLKKNYHVADVGSGSGIIAALAATAYGCHITAIEMQNQMYSCLIETIKLSNLTDKITPVNADIKDYRAEKRFDAVICNPPYRKAGTGKLSRTNLEQNARFSLEMDLQTLLRFCKINMKHGGRLYFSYDADMLVEAISLCRAENIEPKRLRFLQATQNKPAKIMMMECLFGGGAEITIEPPLIQQGNNNEEYENIFSGKWGIFGDK